MTEPRTRVGNRLKGYMNFVRTDVEYYESADGRAWHWPQVGAQSLFISSFFEGGHYCSESGARFDADFMIWGDAKDRVVVVVFDYDLTLFEATTLTNAARFIRPIRRLAAELQRLIDRGSGNPDRPPFA